MKDNTGFTLIELAIAILIISLLLIGLLGPLSNRIEQKDRQATQAQLSEIKEALLGFAIASGRLPCPDTDAPPDGIENPVGGGANCTNVSGTLPFTTLGVIATDSWNNGFTYRVTGAFADSPAVPGGGCPAPPPPIPPATAGESIQLCSQGDIRVDDEAGNVVVNFIPALVFSGAQNNFTATSPHETENTNGDAIFVFTDYRAQANQEYDDLMIWISPNILKTRMVQAGRLP